MKNMPKTRNAEQISTLDAAYLCELYKLNGNHLRAVSGTLYKRECSSPSLKYRTNEELDSRQSGLLRSVGEVPSPLKYSLDTVSKSKNVSAFSSVDLTFYHSFSLAYAFELLFEKATVSNGELLFVTVQLSEKDCIRIEEGKNGFNVVKRRVRDAFSAGLGDAPGVIVFEETKGERFKSGGKRFHFHALYVSPKCEGSKKTLREAVKKLAVSESSSVNLQTSRKMRRFKDTGNGERDNTVDAPIDLGVMDYLSKDIEKRIVANASNIVIKGIRTEITERFNLRYRQFRALKIVRDSIHNEILFNSLSGAIEERLARAVSHPDTVSSPKSIYA